MGIELNIKVTSPLTPDDKDLLSGISVMVLAIANRELAAQGFPEAFPPEEEPEEAPTPSCGIFDPANGDICVLDAGHHGRHRFRDPISVVETDVAKGSN